MPQVTAIVPAAGRSQRMGRCKPLLPLADRPAIRHVLESLQAAGVDATVLVLGPGGEEIAAAVRDLPVTLVWNREPGSDMAASVRAGLGQVGEEVAGVLVWPADLPLVTAETVRALLSRHARAADVILVPACRGRSGHPVLFPRPVLAELEELPTLREVVRRDPRRIERVEVADPGVLLDLDTPDDYRRALAALEASRGSR